MDLSNALPLVGTISLATALLMPIRDGRRGKRATIPGGGPVRALFHLTPAPESGHGNTDSGADDASVPPSPVAAANAAGGAASGEGNHAVAPPSQHVSQAAVLDDAVPIGNDTRDISNAFLSTSFHGSIPIENSDAEDLVLRRRTLAGPVALRQPESGPNLPTDSGLGSGSKTDSRSSSNRGAKRVDDAIRPTQLLTPYARERNDSSLGNSLPEQQPRHEAHAPPTASFEDLVHAYRVPSAVSIRFAKPARAGTDTDADADADRDADADAETESSPPTDFPETVDASPLLLVADERLAGAPGSEGLESGSSPAKPAWLARLQRVLHPRRGRSAPSGENEARRRATPFGAETIDGRSNASDASDAQSHASDVSDARSDASDANDARSNAGRASDARGDRTAPSSVTPNAPAPAPFETIAEILRGTKRESGVVASIPEPMPAALDMPELPSLGIPPLELPLHADPASPIAVVATESSMPARSIPVTRLPLRALSAAITWTTLLEPPEFDLPPDRRVARLRSILDGTAGMISARTLSVAWREERGESRTCALRLLARVSGPEAAPAFVEALREGTDDERAIAIDGLAACGKIAEIEAALDDRADAVVARATLATCTSRRVDDHRARLDRYLDPIRREAVLALLAGVLE